MSGSHNEKEDKARKRKISKSHEQEALVNQS